ncbi:MAG: DUF805 domain-containing protein [Aestuariibaculum sp.]
MNWYLKVIKQYADFNGRARRQEYWMFVLFNIIFAVAAIILDMLIGVATEGGFGIFYILYVLFALLPGLAVTVRRLHDTGKSGWMLLLGLIPLVGPIWLFVLYVTEGDKGSNEYGPDPKIGNIDEISEIGTLQE